MKRIFYAHSSANAFYSLRNKSKSNPDRQLRYAIETFLHILCSLLYIMFRYVLVVNDEMDADTTCLYVHICNLTLTNTLYI